jgi:hypothetical protein
MTRIRLLHGVNRERADGIDTKLVDVWLHLWLNHGISGTGVGAPAK